MNEIEKLLKLFRNEGKQDWVGLWALVWETHHSFPQNKAEEVKAFVMDLVLRMMDTGFVVASVEESKNFVAWPNQSSEYVVQRVSEEWDKLGREPDLGDIAWFTFPKDFCSSYLTE